MTFVGSEGENEKVGAQEGHLLQAFGSEHPGCGCPVACHIVEMDSEAQAVGWGCSQGQLQLFAKGVRKSFSRYVGVANLDDASGTAAVTKRVESARQVFAETDMIGLGLTERGGQG